MKVYHSSLPSLKQILSVGAFYLKKNRDIRLNWIFDVTNEEDTLLFYVSLKHNAANEL